MQAASARESPVRPDAVHSRPPCKLGAGISHAVNDYV